MTHVDRIPSLTQLMTTDRKIRAAIVVAFVLAVAALVPATNAVAVPLTEAGDATLGGRIEQLDARVRKLQSQVDAVQRRESAAQAELDAKLSRQQQIADDLVATRAKVERLQARLARSKRVLSRRVVGVYKAGDPDYLTVVLRADGFAELVQRASFLRRVSEQDRTVIQNVSSLKDQASQQTVRLASLERESAKLVAEVRNRRDAIASERATLAARVAPVAQRLRASRARLAAVTRAREREHASHTPRPRKPGGPDFTQNLTPSGHVTVSPSGFASAPINSPAAVKAAVAAGNKIAKKPYRWGGGHGSFEDSGYDCSGSVSYVLHAAGILSSPLASGSLSSWAKAGPGNWITVYAHAGHTMVNVGGAWFDTSGRGANGSRWQTGGKGTGGYAVRHWPGL
jgi:peptidoglycan hydrolase CwlO-like protein